MKTILVATDGSAAADKALETALDLAEFHGAQIKLLHALLRDKEPDELMRLPGVAADDAAMAKLRELAEGPVTAHSPEELMASPNLPDRPAPVDLLNMIARDVLERAQSRARDRGVAAEALSIADGDAATAVVGAADELPADAIVMGMRGLGHIEEMTFGSVSHEVCRLTRRTCITVH